MESAGSSLPPPLCWLWVSGFILTSGKSQRDDSGALTGSPGTRRRPRGASEAWGRPTVGLRLRVGQGLVWEREWGAGLDVCAFGQVESVPPQSWPHVESGGLTQPGTIQLQEL